MDAADIGRLLVALGLGLAALGGLVLLLGRVVDLGNLPGDLVYRGDNVRIYVPIATMIVVSIVLTVVLNLVLRLFR
jgi:TctA family transporter